MLQPAVEGEVLSGCCLCRILWFFMFCYLLIFWGHFSHYPKKSSSGQFGIQSVLESSWGTGVICCGVEKRALPTKSLSFEKDLFLSKDTPPLLYIRCLWKVLCRLDFWKPHCFKFKIGSVILRKPLSKSFSIKNTFHPKNKRWLLIYLILSLIVITPGFQSTNHTLNMIMSCMIMFCFWSSH